MPKALEKRYRLERPKITRVDLVDKGANYDPETGDGSHVLLYKSEDGGPVRKATFDERRGRREVEDVVGELLSMTSDFSQSLIDAIEGIDGDPSAAVRETIRQYLAAVDDNRAAWLEGNVEKSESSENRPATADEDGGTDMPEEKKTDETPTASADETKAGDETVEKTDDEKTAETNVEADDETKPTDEIGASETPVEKRVETLEKSLATEREKREAAEKRIEKMEDEKITAEVREIAKSVAGFDEKSVDERTDVLKSIKSKVSADEFAWIEKSLRTARTRVEKSAGLSVIGGDGDGSNDAETELEKIAKRYVSDGKAENYPEAYEKACRENPDLYADASQPTAANR